MSGWEPFIYAAVSAVGVGVQYYGQQKAAATQARVEHQNRVTAQRNAMLQQGAILRERKLALAQAEANRKLAQREHDLNLASLQYEEIAAQYAQQIDERNAKSLNIQAEIRRSQGRDDVRRQREQHLRHLASVRSRQGGSGIATDVGSPLQLLAGLAKDFALALSDSHYTTDLESRALDEKADVLRYESTVRNAGSQFAIKHQRSLLDLRFGAERNQNQFQELASRYRAKNELTGVKYQLDAALAVPSRVPAMRASATADLVAGIAGTYSNTYSMGKDAGYWGKPSNTGTKSNSGGWLKSILG